MADKAITIQEPATGSLTEVKIRITDAGAIEGVDTHVLVHSPELARDFREPFTVEAADFTAGMTTATDGVLAELLAAFIADRGF